jgi:signal transduction histidine kinase
MTRRILSVALTSAVIALVLFLVPLAIAVLTLFQSSAQNAVQREALNAAVLVDPAFSVTDLTELPHPGSGIVLSLYDSTGRRVLGTGPAMADSVVRTALGGHSTEGQVDGWLTSVVPLSASEKVTGAVRAAVPVSTVWQRVVGVWVAMLVAAVASIAVGIISARALSRRITDPMRTLALASQTLGSGDFTVRMAPSGLAEIDQAGSAMNATAERLAQLVQRERRMAAHASHQLRTPLAGIRAVLEAALSHPNADVTNAMRVAIERADALDATIDEIIALSREPANGIPVVASAQLDAAESRWRGTLAEAGRPLRVDLEAGLPNAIGVPPALQRILDVLIENAYRHGAGEVTLRARDAYGSIALDVEDEGNDITGSEDIFLHGVSQAGSSGLGLALALQLAEDQGGKLMLSQRHPHTRFTLLLPVIAPSSDSEG